MRTLAQVMRSPRWIGALVFALAVSGVFAWLGQWQLSRAIVSVEVTEAQTESPVPIGGVIEPGAYLNDSEIGQMVEVTGSFVPGDYLVVSNRINLNETGYWVTGHLRTEDDVSLAVGLGWAPDEETADRVAARLNGEPRASADRLTGRLLPSQGPELPAEDADPYEITTMSVALLINRWTGMEDQDVYNGYVVSTEVPDGLVQIDAPPPQPETQVNWLNIFYAAEWVVFAGFAVFFWYRLAKDAWERETDGSAIAAETTAHGERVD
ncbi:hypothetical protein GCM10027416_08420 [Okibacterium endophyticum]